MLALGLLLAACRGGYDVTYPLPPQNTSKETAPPTSKTSAETAATTSSQSSLAESVLIKVPFQTQAPLENWDAVHEQACEEAALILVQSYLNGYTITPEQMQEQIATVISFEADHGYKQDVTVEELKQIAADMFGLHGRILTDVTTSSLKKELAAGHPVIIPVAGRMLKNPYYSGEGPWYHMLVVVGYNDTSFITNDVGTKRGAKYAYSYSTLIGAIHNWTGTDDMIASGPKAVLVLTK